MTDELDAFISQCSKMFSKALIRIITSDAPNDKKIIYLKKLLDKIDIIDNLIVEGKV